MSILAMIPFLGLFFPDPPLNHAIKKYDTEVQCTRMVNNNQFCVGVFAYEELK